MLYDYSQPKHPKALHHLDADAVDSIRAYLKKHHSPEQAGEMRVCEPAAELSVYLASKEPPFSRLLLEFIRESGSDEVEIYKRAYVDRKLFSKIRSNPDYRPKKTTVIAFALALQLSLDETLQLLSSAGFALSGSSHFDLIIRYFVERGEYDFFRINDALYAFDQPVLMM